MQKEMMLRLLKDGKIVGYEKKGMFNNQSTIKITTFQSINIGKNEQWWDMNFHYYIEHDSFELGIKQGDEWWFEGDTGIDMSGYGDKFTLTFNGIVWEKDFHDNVLNRRIRCKNNLADCEKTGNIHEVN